MGMRRLCQGRLLQGWSEDLERALLSLALRGNCWLALSWRSLSLAVQGLKLVQAYCWKPSVGPERRGRSEKKEMKVLSKCSVSPAGNASCKHPADWLGPTDPFLNCETGVLSDGIRGNIRFFRHYKQDPRWLPGTLALSG